MLTLGHSDRLLCWCSYFGVFNASVSSVKMPMGCNRDTDTSNLHAHNHIHDGLP